jgi:hypothetical protein
MLVGIRTIRGQGDCLYRALVYGILEQIILSTTAATGMAEFRKLLGEGIAHLTQSNTKNELERVIALLTTGQEDMCGSTHNLTVQVAQESNGVDKALIRIMRETIYQYVSESRDRYSDDGEFTVQQQMERTDENGRTFEQQLQNILTTGIEATDQLVSTGVVFEALRVKCDVLTPTLTGRYQQQRLNELQRNPTAIITIECKGEHYDIAYIRGMTDMEKFQDKEAQKQDEATIARMRKEDQARKDEATQQEPDRLQAIESHSTDNSNRNTADQDRSEGGKQQNRVFPVP